MCILFNGDNMYYINCFFIYSILGYFLEIIFGFCIGANASSGVLYGPWTPIYGFASLIIILVSDKLFSNLHMNRVKETLIVLPVITVFITFLEFLGGIFIEYFFGFSFWDYTNRPYHLGKYVCLPFSLLWGVLSFIFIYFIRPFIDKYIKMIPNIITYIMIILFIVDWVVRVLVECGFMIY